jgi:DNA helicase IV
MVATIGAGNVAVVVPDSMAEVTSEYFDARGIEHGRAASAALDSGVTIVPVGLVKGLELDGVIVVEPARIVRAEPQGMRALYVALTRSTQRLTVVHAEELPAPMRD